MPNWNLVNTVSDTVGFTSSDSNATFARQRAVDFRIKDLERDLPHRRQQNTDRFGRHRWHQAAYTSPAITVNIGAFAKLQVLAPGEMAAPGSPMARLGHQPCKLLGSVQRDGQRGGR
jgi:hypothetical protein